MDETQIIVQSEKKILIDMLKLYEESPFLWDTGHALYSNREARSNAYELLLEKYKLVHPKANKEELKKKLENMRASYRRERKKVLQDLLKYGDERRPSLWYYEHLKFLDKRNVNRETEDDEDDDEKSNEIENLSSIYLMEEQLEPEETDQSYVVSNKDDNNKTNLTNKKSMTEGESFGTTIGIQLNEMQPVQRYIAEKLISEVIYYARFEKLDVGTRLSNV